MTINPIKTKVFRENEDLTKFIITHISRLKNKSVLVVTSKIVALAEGRTALDGPRRKIKLIKSESEWALKTKWTWLTLKDGLFMAAAGIDASNADNRLILLPKDSYKAAAQIRKALLRYYKIKKIGVIITDSRTTMGRAGITGVALGYAGFQGVKDYRGDKDLFGRKFKMSRTNIADSLAAAAVLTMGEGDERQPLAIIKNAPIEFCERVRKNELNIPFKDDLYKPLFKALRKIKKK